MCTTNLLVVFGGSVAGAKWDRVPGAKIWDLWDVSLGSLGRCVSVLGFPGAKEFEIYVVTFSFMPAHRIHTYGTRRD